MTGLDDLLQQLFPKQQPTFRPTAIEGLLKPQQAEVKPYSPETFTGLLNEQPSVMRQAGLIGASFAPGAGFSDFAGTFPSAQGGTEPSAAQNLQQGNYLTSALQTLGAFGDAATVTGAGLGPLGLAAGFGVGSVAKTPRAVQKGVNRLVDGINPNSVDSVMSELVPQSLLDVSYRGTHTPPDASVYGATLDSLQGIMPANVYSSEGKRLYGLSDRQVDNEWFTAALKAKGNPNAQIDVYRAVPKGVKTINDGDWVSTSKSYVKMHGENTLDGNYEIIKQTVPAKSLHSEGYPYEFGYRAVKSQEEQL